MTGSYQVIGPASYRGHPPGTRFEANLQPGPETRAISRAAIRFLGHVNPAPPPGSYRLPPGWVAHKQTPEAPQGASLIEGSN